MRQNPETLVLGLAPVSRGLGFALLEGPHRLIDWGVKSARFNKDARCLAKTRELLQHYRPEVVVLEDCAGSRRAARVQRLIGRIVRSNKRKKVTTRCFPRTKVKEAFATANGGTKHDIAFAIVERLPELAPHFPPRRRAWMSEDPRMSFFDAIALAMTFFHFKEKRRHSKVHNRS